jgi:CheY-like chemotaxis protein
MARPRVLLVDDDASIRRFVALALEELDVTLLDCASVAQALAALREAPVQLLLTDLMMPGENGLDLLQHLHDEPALRGGALQVVFSAGLDAATRERLAGFDIWRQLVKPVSLIALEDCVREGTRLAKPARSATPVPEQTLTESERAAVLSHFGGDEGLFLLFRASCIPQFALDLHQGDEAVAQGKAPALRLLAHSLKSVLATLGHEPLSEHARQLERAAEAADWPTSHALWPDLRSGLAALVAGARTA